MSFDTTTFFFEIINFIVLVWLLNRILYKPVLNAIRVRQELIGAQLAKAEATKQEALALKERYEERLVEWNTTRSGLMQELKQEQERLREESLRLLQSDLEQERIKAKVVDEEHRNERTRQYEKEALALSARFAARLLSTIASPDIEMRLCQMAIDELENADPNLISMLQQSTELSKGKVVVESTQSLPEDQRLALIRTLSKITGKKLACDFQLQPELLAGVSVDIGSLVLEANLKNELSFFATGAGHFDSTGAVVPGGLVPISGVEA